jgi:hypothetical protein
MSYKRFGGRLASKECAKPGGVGVLALLATWEGVFSIRFARAIKSDASPGYLLHC